MPQKTKNTPMMEQYLAIKQQYPDAFLFYRLGDFYEMFYDDAIKGAQILELTLTTRNKNAVDPIAMCGVPHHAAQNYIDILVEKGYKVAICEQVEDPKLTKGMVKREVVQLITPGTIMDTKAVNTTDNNYLTALYQEQASFGLAYVDLATGELKATVLADLPAVVNELLSLDTKEVVVTTTISSELQRTLEQLKILQSSQAEPTNNAQTSYLTQDLQAEVEIKATAYLLAYLYQTQKRSLGHLQKALHYETAKFLKLDHYTKRNLELLKNTRTGKKTGTLLWLLDQTKTAMGARLLKQWISRPLLDSEMILQRQALVSALLDNYFERSSLQDELSHVYDLERLAGKLAFGNANGRDLIQLKNSLSHVPQIRYLLEQMALPNLNEFLAKLDPLEEVVDLIEQAIVDEPPLTITEGGMIRLGYDHQLDEYLDAMQNGQSWLAQLEEKERQITGIHNLKIGFNRVFGYYIEISKGNVAKLDDERYQRKQTLTNAERFITPELKEKESLILGAQAKAKELEYQLFNAIREQIKDQMQKLQQLAQTLAQLDVYQSFATISEQGQYVKPEITMQKAELEIIDGWHPVVEKVLGKQTYVPNSILMPENCHILLITGPNMSGKSTYMRQLALSVILAQMGCFVPAKSAKLPIFDRIFTRIGAADDLISGESTFMVEMKEANEALQNATSKSLILFDEIGRGTATYDGMALAQAIIEYLHDNVQAKTLFATHYHELTVLDKKLSGLKNIHVGAVEKDGELVFLHKVKEGPADRSYGLHVAKLAGMPVKMLDRAQVILEQLEQKTTATKKLTETKTKKPKEQLVLFEPEEVKLPPDGQQQKVVSELKNLNLMGLTPLEIMNKVYQWQKKLSD